MTAVRPYDRDAFAIVKEYEQFKRQMSGGGGLQPTAVRNVRLKPAAASNFPEIITIAPRPG